MTAGEIETVTYTQPRVVIPFCRLQHFLNSNTINIDFTSLWVLCRLTTLISVRLRGTDSSNKSSPQRMCNPAQTACCLFHFLRHCAFLKTMLEGDSSWSSLEKIWSNTHHVEHCYGFPSCSCCRCGSATVRPQQLEFFFAVTQGEHASHI